MAAGLGLLGSADFVKTCLKSSEVFMKKPSFKLKMGTMVLCVLMVSVGVVIPAFCLADDTAKPWQWSGTDNEKSVTILETVKIFNKALVSFNELGLFPNDATFNKIKKLTPYYEESLFLKFLILRNPKNFIVNKETKNDLVEYSNNKGLENRLCLIFAEIRGTMFISPMAIACEKILHYLDNFFTFLLENFPNLFDELALAGFLYIWGYCYLGFLIASMINPFAYGNSLGIGGKTWDMDGNPIFHSSDGWIETVGLFGKKNFTGSMFGQISEFFTILGNFFVGVNGFTGLKIMEDDFCKYYLGFATRVNISSSPPKFS